MTEILAAIENSRTSRDVLDTTRIVANLLGARTEAVYVHENDASVASSVCAAAGIPLRLLIGEPAPAMVRALHDGEVVAGVIGAGRFRTVRHPVGRVTHDVLAGTPKPIVVVPPEPTCPRARRPAVVVPLDGLGPIGSGTRALLGRLAGGGAELVAVPVFDVATAPRFWDHYHHDFAAWYDGVVSRCALPVSRVHAACGTVIDEVCRVAADEEAALVAVPWSRDNATQVTELLRTTRTPVLLVPERVARRHPDDLALASPAGVAG